MILHIAALIDQYQNLVIIYCEPVLRAMFKARTPICKTGEESRIPPLLNIHVFKVRGDILTSACSNCYVFPVNCKPEFTCQHKIRLEGS